MFKLNYGMGEKKESRKGNYLNMKSSEKKKKISHRSYMSEITRFDKI